MTMQVTTKGLKSRDQVLRLDGLTVVAGPNGSGKSTAAEAIRFLGLGYVPALGKRPVDTAALMSDREMSVELTLPDGRQIRRFIARGDRGYVQGAEASWIRNGKGTEVSEEIKRLFGAEDQDAAECLDIRELLAATPNQRVVRLEALASAGRKTADELAEAVARNTIMRLADVAPERMPAKYMTALEMVPEKQQAVLLANAAMLKAKLRDGGLAGAGTWANEEKRGANDGLHRKEQAAKELRIRAAEVPEPDPREIAALETRRQELDRALGAARQAATQAQDRARRLEAAQLELTTAREADASWAAYMRDEQDSKAKLLKDMKERLAEHEAAEPKPPVLLEDARIDDLAAEATAARRRADVIVIPAAVTTDAEERDIKDLEAALVEARKSPWAEVLEIAEEIEDRTTSKGSKTSMAPAIKRLRELARTNAKDPAVVKDALDHAHENLRAARERQEKVGKERAHLQRQVEDLRASAEKKDAQARAIAGEVAAKNRTAHQDHSAKHDAWRQTFVELRGQAEDVQRELETASTTAARARARREAAERALEAVGPEPKAAADPASLEADLKKVAEGLGLLLRAKAVHQEIQRALDAIEDAKAEAAVFSAIEWGVQRQRDAELSTAGGPLLAHMGEFLAAAGRQEKPFVRAGNGACAIGWTRPDGTEITVQAMSGGEWCLFAAALTTAVLVLRNPEIRLLLIEAGETDEVTLPQLLAGVAAFKDRLSGALVMTPRAPARRAADWRVVVVSEAAVEAA